MNMRNSFRFNLGGLTCLALRDGGRTSTIEQEIVDVPPADLSAAMRAAGFASDEVEVGFNVLLVEMDGQRILVDTGTGRGQLLSALGAEGVEPGQIDTVILTHGDGDHIGGILDGAGEPTFANARYVLWREAWDQWTDPARRGQMLDQFLTIFRRRGVDEAQLARMAEGRAAYATQTLPRIHDRLDLVELDQEFLPGLRLVDGRGHRSDQVAVAVNGRGASLLHVADAVRHPVQMVHPDWNGSLDSFPVESVATRRRLLHRAAQEKSLIFAAHLPFPGAGWVDAQGDGWAWRPYTD